MAGLIRKAAGMHYLLDKINIKNKMFCCRIYEPDDYGNLEEEEHMHLSLIHISGGYETPAPVLFPGGYRRPDGDIRLVFPHRAGTAKRLYAYKML